MSKKNKNGFTRQGVRDLSNIKGTSRGIRLEMPPDMVSGTCDHAFTKADKDGDLSCTKCGAPLY